MLAGRDPANVSIDSDLDWGQDVLALERYMAAHPVPELYVVINGSARLCRHRLPPLRQLPAHPVTGTIAVSELSYRMNGGRTRADPCEERRSWVSVPAGWLDWLRAHEPVALVGATIRLYRIR